MSLKFSDLHFGKAVLLKTLRKTEDSVGSDSNLRELKGQLVTVFEFDDWDSNYIQIQHPILDKRYAVHLGDISLIDQEPGDEAKRIQILEGDEVVFDEKELFL